MTAIPVPQAEAPERNRSQAAAALLIEAAAELAQLSLEGNPDITAACLCNAMARAAKPGVDVCTQIRDAGRFIQSVLDDMDTMRFAAMEVEGDLTFGRVPNRDALNNLPADLSAWCHASAERRALRLAYPRVTVPTHGGGEGNGWDDIDVTGGGL